MVLHFFDIQFLVRYPSIEIIGIVEILRIRGPNFLIIAALLCAILGGIASLIYYILFKFLSRLFVVL